MCGLQYLRVNRLTFTDLRTRIDVVCQFLKPASAPIRVRILCFYFVEIKTYHSPALYFSKEYWKGFKGNSSVLPKLRLKKFLRTFRENRHKAGEVVEVRG